MSERLIAQGLVRNINSTRSDAPSCFAFEGKFAQDNAQTANAAAILARGLAAICLYIAHVAAISTFLTRRNLPNLRGLHATDLANARGTRARLRPSAKSAEE